MRRGIQIVSHQHWCPVEGHHYTCSDDCLCICDLPMNGNDHSECPVELRPCPDHPIDLESQVTEKALPEGVVEINFAGFQGTARPQCQCGCSVIDSSKVVGWCFHCNHVYANYSSEIEARHFAYHCPGAPSETREFARARLSTN
jgi:hypothetical protein